MNVADSRPDQRPRADSDGRVPKLLGADIELGNFIQDAGAGSTGHLAARELLEQIDGVRHAEAKAESRSSAGGSYGTASTGYYWGQGYYGGYCARAEADPDAYQPYCQDWGRKFLPTCGGCCYIDLGHLELALPETLGALAHCAAQKSMLRVAQDAMDKANADRPADRPIQVLVNNSDGQGSAWGAHLNVAVSRRCFDNIFRQRLHYMGLLASHLAGGVLWGQGKVGSEDRRPACDYQLSQRADFFRVLLGPQTTYDRPIVNTRDESLCGPSSSRATAGTWDDRIARVHLIPYDASLCDVACVIKAGSCQLVLAMLEQDQVPTELILDSPIEAIGAWSHDPTLSRRARLVAGGELTAVEHQLEIADRARAFVEAGRAEGIVPDAERVLSLWEMTLLELRAGDEEALSGKLDWVLKRRLCEQAIRSGNLDWNAPQIKYVDHLYAHLAPDRGLYWAMERAGAVQRLVSAAQIERGVHEPPDETRAWLRAQILRRVDRDAVVSVDWDEIRLRLPPGGQAGRPVAAYRLPMHVPWQMGRAECEAAFARADGLFAALVELGMREELVGSASGGSSSTFSETPDLSVPNIRETEGDHHGTGT
jgi:hypothetical protein